MLGKLAPYLVIGLVEMALILLVMRFGFDVPIRGSLVFLFAMAIIYLFALLALGPFISTRAQTQIAGAADGADAASAVDLPVGLHLPGRRAAARAAGDRRGLPATHMVAIMRGVVLRDAGPVELMPHVLALVAISVVLVWMSARRFKKVAS